MWFLSQFRDQWLSFLVFWNYSFRKCGWLPDRWYWADKELIERGRTWMPCYWSVFRFRGLSFDFRCHLRIIRLKIKLWWWNVP